MARVVSGFINRHAYDEELVIRKGHEKKTHGDLHLVADGPMTSDFVSTQKKGEFDCRIREKCSFLLLLFIFYLFSIYLKDIKGLLNI